VSYADELKANRRLCILRLLVEERGHSNESVLELALRSLGHHAGLDRAYVRDQLTFLETAGAITIKYFKDRLMVVQLTERGASAASGAITIDGIAEPGFGG